MKVKDLLSNTTLKRKVFVGLSGGVDSAVAAALLKQQGYSVRGVFLREYDLSMSDAMRDQIQCSQEDDRAQAVAVTAFLDIPFEEWDFRKEYGEKVVATMLKSYARGTTPNPDVMCNKHIKFGLFLKEARKRGGDCIATGHYVKNVSSHKLCIAKDTNKDQSYFLYTLSQAQLKYCLFPLGKITKPEVRAIAKKIGLPNWNRKDSQGVCFIGKIGMKDFLQTKVPVKKGKLITVEGEQVGTHDGAAYFTIGQRHGIGYGGGGKPYYVVGKDMKKNTVTVAQGEKNPALFAKKLECGNVHWISGTAPSFPLRARARIRYRQPLQLCQVVGGVRSGRVRVVFDKKQRAITPGQAIVFYKGKECLGGGVIL